MKFVHVNEKTMKSNSVPAGYHSINPSLIVRGGAAAVEFYQRALGATLQRRMDMPDGKIMHAELAIGDSVFMLGEENADWGMQSPLSLGGTTTTLQIYVEDADATFNQAIAAGGQVVFPVIDQFWGDRTGTFKDPFGHRWMVATRIEEVSDEETARRAEAWMQNPHG